MRIARIFLLVAAAAATLAAAAPASAHGYHRGGPRVSFSVGFGVPAYYPYWYGPRYYYPYYPPAVVVSSPPVTYVEQQPAPVVSAPPAPAPQAQNPAAGFWYYCADSSAYYPYVQQCASGWQRVSPTPPGQ